MNSEAVAGLIYFERFSKFVGYGKVYEYVFRGISEEEADRYGFRLSYVVTDSIGTECTFEYTFEYTALDAVFDLLDGVGTFVDPVDEEYLLNLKEYLIERDEEQSVIQVYARIQELDDSIEELRNQLDRSRN